MLKYPKANSTFNNITWRFIRIQIINTKENYGIKA